MAKISRRTVASSIPASSISAASSSSNSNSASSQGNPNNIQHGGKPQRSTHSTEHIGKHSSIEGSGTAAATGTYPDPLRLGAVGSQFTTRSIPQTESPALGASSAPQFSTARPTPTSFSSSSTTPTYNKTAMEAERQRIRDEFFATYDVMTGVRIAATLGGFFGLMVFLIVWKSRSSSNETLKVLKDPKMAAVAAVCMQEEEERKIQEAMVATGMSIYPDEYDAILYRRQRMLSLGNVSAPPVLHRSYRFSSVGGGGYSSLLEPPRRFSYSYGGQSGSSLHVGAGSGRRKSGSESSRILSNYPMGSSFGMDDYFMETDDEVENGTFPENDQELEGHHKRSDSTKDAHGLLEVPHVGYDSRRSSAMTCCSTESSYLERRCSAFTLGLGNLPPSLQRKLSTTSRTSSTDLWDYYYPDIQVIQPTPKASPCPSERSIYEQLQPSSSVATATTKTLTQNLATSASIIKPTTTTTITSKTAKPTKAANGNGATATQQPTTFVRKHSIAYYDPESAQSGRKQQIHSISADTVDFFPYNQAAEAISGGIPGGNGAYSKAIAPIGVGGGGGNIHQSFRYNDSPTEELRLNVRRKIAVVELQRSSYPEHTPTTTFENNNSFPYTNSAAAIVTATASAAAANSSSLSIDSTPASLDKLNGSGSLGICGNEKILFDTEKRAPLASLSSFKISSLEYQDSELRSLDEDSVFLDSVADTDEDMQQFSSDSEEASLGEPDAAALSIENVVTIEQPTVTIRTNESQKYAIEKRYSLGACNLSVGGSQISSRPRRPLLQRHRTISASSSDRISLIDQQLKEFPSGYYVSSGSGTQTPTTIAPAPLETHFGTTISTCSPPTHPRRAQLLQQYSDPQSLPTNTTTEEDTCSTMNTEVCANAAAASPGTASDIQRRSSSISRCSPPHLETHPANSSAVAVSDKASSSQSFTKYQLPRSRLADDPCASSISDSVITTSRQPIICVPSSLKNLILRGTSSAQAEKFVSPTAAVGTTPTTGFIINKSSTNLSMLETADDMDCTTCPSVMLELPLIKLPTEESSDSSSASNDIERSRSVSDESRDPSLPGSSRKWSKETLF